MTSTGRLRIVMLTPVSPQPAGNGLAMRLWLVLLGALSVADVHLVVVPIWRSKETRSLPDLPGLLSATVLRPGRLWKRSVNLGWRTEAQWRERYARLEPVHESALRAPPAKASDIAALVGTVGADAVLSMRLSLAPLGLAVSERLGAALIVDADDDDEAFFRATGSPEAAAAFGRIAAECLPLAALVTTASADDALALALRHDLGERAQVLANAVRLPDVAMPDAPGEGRILFIGTLRYGPNVEAARWLVREVSPRITRPHQIDLVGLAGPEVVALASDHVVVHGVVPEVWPHYRDADVAVAPLLSGSGTRIKILEAFAHRRQVVSTTKGAEGIAAQDGRQLYLADSAEDFARAIERALDGAGRDALVDAAYELVAREYEIAAAAVRIGELFRQRIAR